MTQEIERLNAECERAWEAYRIAHNQAMTNGESALDHKAQAERLRKVLEEIDARLWATHGSNNVEALIGCLKEIEHIIRASLRKAPPRDEGGEG